MMVVYPCSPRVFLVPVALLLTVSLLTVFRSNYGLPSPRSSFPHLASLGRGRGNVPVKEPPAADTASKTTATCSAHDLDHLRQPELGLTKTILYTRRCIKPIRSGDLDRDAVANISTPLITGTIRLNPTAADCPAIELPACEPISLHVPPTYPEQQHRHLLFGVASRYERLNESLPVFAHWLAGTGARLVAVAADAELPYTNFDLAALEAAYRRAGIDARIIPPSLKTGVPRKTKSNQHEARPGRPPPIEQLHLMLIRDLLDADADEAGWRGTSEGSTETRWLGVLDDDTFFPSLYPLARELARHDHARPALLGQLADSLASVRRYGVMAYGGAGVFVSVPLARRLAPRLEDCIRESESNEGRGGTAGGGDVMLRDCVRRYTAVSLTLVEGLHQLDIRGDPSGFFESGRRVLSLHHWCVFYPRITPFIPDDLGLAVSLFFHQMARRSVNISSNHYPDTRKETQ